MGLRPLAPSPKLNFTEISFWKINILLKILAGLLGCRKQKPPGGEEMRLPGPRPTLDDGEPVFIRLREVKKKGGQTPYSEISLPVPSVAPKIMQVAKGALPCGEKKTS